ncbi:hypothetical protein L6164_024656 [Bauhinia variegata]|uniref:Uncharacterized protein n=1 Tax=Bauhinia variegata TaxID=167791 RepID=A0ACB9LYG6_BAUVA|nr:hypothetical protein L6164_024656 [Bauhinia variegata]
MEMENFSVRETRTSSRTVPESCELTLPAKLPTKHKHLQGIISTETDSMSGADWTDEKHSLYLKFMEASFVDQLYDSKEMLGWRSPNSTTSSAQFKVLRGGSWKKINFGRNNSEMNRTYERHDLKVNQWIQHFRPSTKHPTHEDSSTTASTSEVVDLSGRKEISNASEIETITMRESHMLCNETETGDVEMSDQNFVDEEVEGEKENNRSHSKRMKSRLL